MAAGPRRALSAAAVGLALAACAPGGSRDAPAATADCATPEQVALQVGGHLIGDREPPVPYSSSPPTSGWHSALVVPVAVYAEPLSEPEQVSVLEGGAVVVTHRGLAEQDIAALGAMAEGELAGRAAVTPYDRLAEGEVVLAGWGVLQRCDALDLAAVRAFVSAYADAAPDPTHG